MVHGGTGRHHAPVTRSSFLALAAAVLLAACSAGGAPAASLGTDAPAPSGAAVSPDPSSDVTPASNEPSPGGTWGPPPSPGPGLARLEPADGAYFGLNLDWGSVTAADAAARLGRTPVVWVQFARFPLDDGARANLDAFIEQVAGVGGIALITLEPHDGLAAVTEAAADDLADRLAGYWTNAGVATFVRFAHEMNGSWYPWAQAPTAYVEAFRTVADAVHDRSPASAMVWAPNEGGGYPFSGGPYAVKTGSAEAALLDTDGDGEVTGRDDAYAPYYPGDEAVDWVGMSLYHWGLGYPWGENELPRPGSFAALLRGEDLGAHEEASNVPDFYEQYVDGHDKPLAIVETAILYDPAAPGGPSEAEIKTAWFQEVFGPATPEAFPRIRMLSWFEWRKQEPEVGRVIDWRLGADPALAERLLDGVTPGWLRFAD
jgi:hypothetical protein